MQGVNSLSGYLDHKEFPLVIFSIMNNHASASATTIRNAIDAIVVLLARLRQC